MALHTRIWILIWLVVGLDSELALAQRDSVAAEAVFQQARELLEAGNVVEACPKFAESYRLDPATGTLLGLAMCHERESKLASAWSEFTEVLGRARVEGQEERAEFAEQRISELQPRLSTLTIEVPPDVAAIDGLEITKNGTAVGAAIFGSSVPVDGGEVLVEARAPGKQTWQRKVSIAIEKAAAVVTIPPLAEASADVASAPRSSATAEDGGAPPTQPPLFTPLQWTGLGVAGAGVVSLGLGGYFLSDAFSKKSESEDYCTGDECGPEGLRLRSESVDSGNFATVFGVGGLVLLGGGATLYFLAPKPSETAGLQLRSVALVGDGRATLATFRGTFY